MADHDRLTAHALPPVSAHTGTAAEPAKAICRRCPHQQECLTWALDTNQQFGVWGALSADERRALRRGRKAA